MAITKGKGFFRGSGVQYLTWIPANWHEESLVTLTLTAFIDQLQSGSVLNFSPMDGRGSCYLVSFSLCHNHRGSSFFLPHLFLISISLLLSLFSS